MRISTFAAAFFGMLAVTPAHAEHSIATDSFEIGIEGMRYEYRETDFVKLQGYGGGIDGTYTYNWANYFLKANAQVDFYNLDYSSQGSGTETGITDYKQDLRGLFGYNIKVSKATTVAPYIGVGYRMLFDANGEKLTTTGASGYDRRSQYIYAPIGVGVNFKAGKWGFRTFAEYDYLLRGYQTSYVADLGFDNNLTNKQTSGYGIRGSVMVSPPVDFYNLSVGPYARYWNIKDSDPSSLSIGGQYVGYGFEPHNNTFEYGLEASIRFQ